MLLCIIRKFDNIIYVCKQHDTCEERDNPVIEPSVNYLFHILFFLYLIIINCNWMVYSSSRSRHHFLWSRQGEFQEVNWMQVRRLKGLNEILIWSEFFIVFCG